MPNVVIILGYIIVRTATECFPRRSLLPHNENHYLRHNHTSNSAWLLTLASRTVAKFSWVCEFKDRLREALTDVAKSNGLIISISELRTTYSQHIIQSDSEA